ncbi:MAG TPA: MauE/DoxX family redox-associated membrane protein [Pyrinomonadaceae bacterium]|nr:MauE/DoxX family redox-associated membrane protein [Pyrinomonadaceae bacterium]
MTSIIVLIRLFLSFVFGIAGIAKFLDQEGSRESLTGFGLSPASAATFAILLPAGELAVCLGLLFGATAWVSSCAALLLLCVFIAVIGVNLRRGNTPDCHCFGQLYSRPLGRGTLLRNGIFALLAGVVVFVGPRAAGPNVWTFLADLFANQPRLAIAGSIFAVIAIVSVWLYLRKSQSSHAAESKVSSGLPIDSVAPRFELPAFGIAKMSLADLLASNQPVMLLFANPKCGPCAAIFEEVGQWQQQHTSQITIAVVSRGTMKDNFVNTARYNLNRVLLQDDREVAELYEAQLTPSAVIVRQDGLIGSRVVAGADEIRALLHSTIGLTSSS